MDGLGLADQFAGRRLVDAGLITFRAGPTVLTELAAGAARGDLTPPLAAEPGRLPRGRAQRCPDAAHRRVTEAPPTAEVEEVEHLHAVRVEVPASILPVGGSCTGRC